MAADEEDADLEPFEDERLQALQYARLHELVSDHLDMTSIIEMIASMQAALPQEPVDVPDLASILPQPDFPPRERLELSKGAAMLLKEVNDRVYASEPVFPVYEQRKSKHLRAEIPLLKTDHETDMRRFKKREDVRWERLRKLPAEVLDEENDEGFSWPSKMLGLPDLFTKMIQEEKVVMTKEQFVMLHQMISVKMTIGEVKEVWESVVPYKKRSHLLAPLSPPLMPLPPPPNPHVPSSPTAQLPLLSDPASGLSEELRALEHNLFDHESPPHLSSGGQTPGRSNEGSSDAVPTEPRSPLLQDLVDPSGYFAKPPPFPVETRIKTEDLKVEPPLMPLSSSPRPKSVHFSDLVDELYIPEALSHSASPHPPGEPIANRKGPEITFDNDASIFEPFMFQMAEDTTRRSEQEKLLPADTLQRVEVPIMDFSLPNPPWDEMEKWSNQPAKLRKLQKDMILNLLSEHAMPERLHGMSKLETVLGWMPFKQQSKMGLRIDEQIEDHGEVEKYLQDICERDVVDSSKLIWRPDRLRIFREDDEQEEEEIETGNYSVNHGPPQSLESLVKKRKLEYGDISLADKHTASKVARGLSPRIDEFVGVQTGLSGASRNQLKKRKLVSDMIPVGPAKQPEGVHNIIGDGSLLMANDLDNFMEIRGKKKQKLHTSSYFVAPQTQAQANTRPTPKEIISRPAPRDPHSFSHRHRPLVLSPKPPTPAATSSRPPTLPFKAPTVPVTFFLTSAIFDRRAIVRGVTKLLPTADFLSRKLSRAGEEPTDVDIITSPGTGIILTSLPKIKQRSLPGSKKLPEILQQISSASWRYERLYVLVSEGILPALNGGVGAAESAALTKDDTIALTELIAFCHVLECSIQVLYTPGGDPELCENIAAVLCKHALPNSNLPAKLLQDETHWELWLRQAGLDVFAAQIILGMLRAPEELGGQGGLSPSKRGLFGLSAFVEMGRDERVRRFEPVMGGKTVLRRVSSVIDREWGQGLRR